MFDTINFSEMKQVPTRTTVMCNGKIYWPIASFDCVETLSDEYGVTFEGTDEYDLVWNSQTGNYLLLRFGYGTSEYMVEGVIPSIVVDVLCEEWFISLENENEY